MRNLIWIRKLQAQGFTLVELMIVVGIIGILVSIAAPNFAKYQSRARQTEASLAISAVYDTEQSFSSQYAAYWGSLDAIGYAPVGTKRLYNVGWASTAGSVTAYPSVPTSNAFFAASGPITGCTGGATTAPIAFVSATDSQVFNATAVGCIRSGATTNDGWSINENKTISNFQNGI